MAEPLSNSAEAQEPTFEQALEQLEGIVHDLEEGRIGLAESLSRYEQGIKLLKQCYGLLQRAERRIELLNSADSQGRAETEPFDDQVMSLEEKAQARSRRRSKRKSLPPESAGENSARHDDVDESGTLF